MSKIAAIQMASGPNIQANLEEAAKLIESAVASVGTISVQEVGEGAACCPTREFCCNGDDRAGTSRLC